MRLFLRAETTPNVFCPFWNEFGNCIVSNMDVAFFLLDAYFDRFARFINNIISALNSTYYLYFQGRIYIKSRLYI